MLLFFEVITMIFVGIDVAKDTHYATVSDDSGAVLVKPFAFQNNAEGFCLLLKKLSEFDRSKLLIGLESTGIYSENLICFLYESGFRLAVINPIQTATLRKTAIRKTKTDKVDTMLIIKSLMVNSYRLYSQRDADSLKLRTLCRFRQNLKKSKARLKIQLAGYVNLVSRNSVSFSNQEYISLLPTLCLRSILHPRRSPPYAHQLCALFSQKPRMGALEKIQPKL